MANPLFRKSKEEALGDDAYVAYCDGDYKWVYEPLRSFLEEKRNCKLLLSDRGDGDCNCNLSKSSHEQGIRKYQNSMHQSPTSKYPTKRKRGSTKIQRINHQHPSTQRKGKEEVLKFNASITNIQVPKEKGN
ncbi:Hypothetical predicted protein [Mytilus galloprovincialis]|uniref:Uncharacterized protein n=1 Tax=Mytilus galloprovincialis TaxID=29158 RepID=A0A8B6EVZ5_MYTGA|nr:Hypothetical predicted protein [Mytilus galloprovincialis]